MSDRATDSVVQWLIGGGAVALAAAMWKGINALRLGVRAAERESIADISEGRRAAVRDRSVAERDSAFWQRMAARYAAQLERHGFEPEPPNPVPPSENGNGNAPRASERRG